MQLVVKRVRIQDARTMTHYENIKHLSNITRKQYYLRTQNKKLQRATLSTRIQTLEKHKQQQTQNTNAQSERTYDLAIKICVLRTNMNDQPKRKQNKTEQIHKRDRQTNGPEMPMSFTLFASTDFELLRRPFGHV